jgi:hypothetical protein
MTGFIPVSLLQIREEACKCQIDWQHHHAAALADG